MNRLGDTLREVRQRLGLSQTELGLLLDVAPATVSMRENGRMAVPSVELERLATATRRSFVVTPAGWQALDPVDPLVENADRSDRQLGELAGEGLPFIGQAGAGPAVASMEDARETFSLDRRWLGRVDCVVEVRGDSMTPQLADGDLVGVQLYRSGEAPRLGEVVAAWLPGPGEVAIKVWAGLVDGRQTLLSTNISYPPLTGGPAELVPRGRVWGIVRLDGIRLPLDGYTGWYSEQAARAAEREDDITI